MASSGVVKGSLVISCASVSLGQKMSAYLMSCSSNPHAGTGAGLRMVKTVDVMVVVVVDYIPLNLGGGKGD